MIAIAGGKGGCGKTTTALAVARALVARGVRTRAVDLDAGMPNLHRLAGVGRDPTLADLAAEVSAQRDGTDAQATGHVDGSGVEVVPAPRATASLDLRRALEALRTERTTTLLDCPAGAGPDATTPLRAAAGVILVSTARTESLEDAAKTGRMARSLGLPIVGAVVTRADAPPDRARSALPTERLIAVPEVRAPLGDRCALERYGVVADWVLERRARTTGTRDGRCEPTGTRGRGRAAPASERRRRRRSDRPTPATQTRPRSEQR